MLKGSATLKDGRVVLIFGMTDSAINELKAGQPIFEDARKFGLPATILIFHSETTESAAATLRAHGIPWPPQNSSG